MKNTENFATQLAEYRTMTEQTLIDSMAAVENTQLARYMGYSLLDGGKRVRAVLVLEFARLCGGDRSEALALAAAVEMIHAFSLVHDDLPCMDDDDFRRGKPSLHKAFGEAEALLAGDALLNLAYGTIAETFLPLGRAETALHVICELTRAVGGSGMIGGQLTDISGMARTEAELVQLSEQKTGALIVAAVKCGCLLSGADTKQLKSAQTFAQNLGLAFQVKDDILDLTGTTEVLGKPAGSDIREGKYTFATLLGVQQAEEMINRLLAEGMAAIKAAFEDTVFLEEFTDMLAGRTH